MCECACVFFGFVVLFHKADFKEGFGKSEDVIGGIFYCYRLQVNTSKLICSPSGVVSLVWNLRRCRGRAQNMTLLPGRLVGHVTTRQRREQAGRGVCGSRDMERESLQEALDHCWVF